MASEMNHKEPQKSPQEVWQGAVAEVLKDANEVAERAGVGPAQALLAMLLLEVSGLRSNLEDGILFRLGGRGEAPPEPESGEEWKGE